MYKCGLIIVFVILHLNGNFADPPEPKSRDVEKLSNDIISDVEFQKNLMECKKYCRQQDSKHDAEQTCKVFPEKKLVLTDCEVTCMKISKEEANKASTCPCVKGECVGDTKPPQNAATKYIPEIFTVLFIVYTVNYVI